MKNTGIQCVACGEFTASRFFRYKTGTVRMYSQTWSGTEMYDARCESHAGKSARVYKMGAWAVSFEEARAIEITWEEYQAFLVMES